MTPALERALRGRGPLILDFDGPVCSLFAGYPAADVAEALRHLVLQHTGDPVPADVAENDPLQILAWSAANAPATLTSLVEDALCAAELAAAETATLTPGVLNVVTVATESGRRVGIASNNSTPAVRRALDRFGLTGSVSYVAGRPPGSPGLMKPHPHVLIECAAALRGDCDDKPLFVGDSLSDITAAQAAGIAVIALANRPTKDDRFRQAAADVVMTTMDGISAVLGLWWAGRPARH